MTTKNPPKAPPAGFRAIRLELARERSHPEGSAQIGYMIAAPLGSDGRIDAETWRDHRQFCRVTRFRTDEEPVHGHLIRRPGGSWALHYDVDGDLDDEAGYHFGEERFLLGEYVSIQEGEKTHTYRVTSVERLK
jgi:hypothetical protein